MKIMSLTDPALELSGNKIFLSVEDVTLPTIWPGPPLNNLLGGDMLHIVGGGTCSTMKSVLGMLHAQQSEHVTCPTQLLGMLHAQQCGACHMLNNLLGGGDLPNNEISVGQVSPPTI